MTLTSRTAEYGVEQPEVANAARGLPLPRLPDLAVRVEFSAGRHALDATQLQQRSGTFDELIDWVSKTKEHGQKDGVYFCGPLRDGRRIAEAALPVRYAALDLDKVTDEIAMQRIIEAAERWHGFGYTTFRHQPEAGVFKMRLVFVLDRAVSRAEYARVCAALARGLAKLAGVAVERDEKCDKPEQPLYTVRKGATIWRFDGEAVRVDQALASAPVVETPAPAGLDHIKTTDPTLTALRDQGRILRDLRGGKFAIRCPFEAEHTTPHAAGDSSTAYLLPHTGGYPRGHFACQHAHCVRRTDADFLRALGLHTERAPEAATAGRIAYRRASDVHAKPIRWLWKRRIARGKVSVLAGHPGLGKSQITASMAAIVSTGGLWPVDRTRSERGNVIFLSAEDDAEDTIRPRLEAAGADLSRVFILDAVIEGFRPDGAEMLRMFNLKLDLARLAALIGEIGEVALIVIDPISAYLGDTDSHVNAEVRALLSPLAEMAAKAGAAVVCVSHLNKGGNSEALMRVTGSLAFVAAARAAFIVAKDQEDGNRRLFLPLKNNVANDQTGLAFSVQGAQVPSPAGAIDTARVVWEAEAVTVTADEAMAQQVGPEERTATEDAREFLLALLADGPVSAGQAKRDADGAGFNWRTVQRAADRLGVERRKEGGHFGGGKQQWLWALKTTTKPEDDKERNMSPSGRVVAFRDPTGIPSSPDGDLVEAEV